MRIGGTVLLAIVFTRLPVAGPKPYTGTEKRLIALYAMEDASFQRGKFFRAVTNVTGTPNQRGWVSGADSSCAESMAGSGHALKGQPRSSPYRAGKNDWNTGNPNFTAECNC